MKEDLNHFFTGNQVPQPVSREDRDVSYLELVWLPSFRTRSDIGRRFITIKKGFVLIDKWDFSGTFYSRKGLDIFAVLNIAQETFLKLVIAITKPLEVDCYSCKNVIHF